MRTIGHTQNNRPFRFVFVFAEVRQNNLYVVEGEMRVTCGNLAIPVGELGIIAMKGCEEIAARVDSYIREWRKNEEQSFLIKAECPRFGSGEGKGIISESVRGSDLFIICDVLNYGVTYQMYGMETHMSPDDHYQDLKRIISATSGKTRRLTVIMPYLYEGRQHRRSGRESLDCALALQELKSLGVENILTFDAHDSRVQNAIPLGGFENIQPYYQMIKALVRAVPDVQLDAEHNVIISPDEGGMSRCIYYSSLLGLELGMFYKRRDYSKIVNGRNPIVSHEFLGDDVEGKDVIIVDDIISSGDSIIDIAEQLKSLHAKRIFVFSTFGLFCEGLERFDVAYEQGLFDRIFTTNLNYRMEELSNRPWYREVDMSKYIAYLIDSLNYDRSLSSLLDPAAKINALLNRE